MKAPQFDKTALKALQDQILLTPTLENKLKILDENFYVKEFLSRSKILQQFLTDQTLEGNIAIKSVLAINQGHIVFQGIDHLANHEVLLQQLLQKFLEIESFYAFLGGIIGYYVTIIELISDSKKNVNERKFLNPVGFDTTSMAPEIRLAIRAGIDSLPIMAEMYPVGGAGDRLDLYDETSGEPLPAAELLFEGRSLLEGLIRDLQAKEYLFWKLHGKQITIPVAMMTSHEKDNHARVFAMCSESNWFGRPPESFKLFTQPLVPVVTQHGDFALFSPLKLVLKPGGHGVIWKLALDHGIIEWLEKQGKEKLLMRQINNPVAGTDSSIFSLCGIGCKEKKSFGFASCPRLVNAAEGSLVLIETSNENGFSYSISNIEYSDFQSQGLEDVPVNFGEPYSAFPANTNVLFADIAAIKKTVQECAVPGLLVNMKNRVATLDDKGKIHHPYGGRLESMMQNIADHIIDSSREPLAEVDFFKLKSYMTYNQREKIISVTKKQFTEKNSPFETPVGSFYDQLQNCRDLLSHYCRMCLPTQENLESYLVNGPSFIMRYHPSLGPLYEVIGQKICGGQLRQKAELCLEIAELYLENITVDGSLHIIATDIFGHHDSNGIVYSDKNGKCELHNVVVLNRGIRDTANHCYWKNEIVRDEVLIIHLEGNAEFFASGVTFKGGQRIEVPNGYRLEMKEVNGQIQKRLQKIDKPTWAWHYAYDDENRVILTRKIH